MSDYQNEQGLPEETSGNQDGASNQASPNDAYIPPEVGAGHSPQQQDYQPQQQDDRSPQKGYYNPRQDYPPPPQGYPGCPPPPPWNYQEYPRSESSTTEKVFKVIGITLLIITAIVAFAVVGCFALIFFPW